MDDMYNKMQQRCKIYAIVYTLSKAIKKINVGDNFLIRTITQTTCIYKENDELSRFGIFKVCLHRFIYESIHAEWNSRMERADYLLSIIDVIDYKEEHTSKLTVMHCALEQICIALLCIFWEFKPSYYSLSYLMHLCSHFTELPRTIFPKETYGLQRIYYILCNVHHLMRFKSQNEFSKRDVDKAYNRCEQFYKEAKSLGEKELKYLAERME